MKVGIYSLAFASDVEAAHQLQPLGMNVRTLQRHLEEGDATFSELINEMRRDLALPQQYCAQGCSDKLLKSGLRLSTPEKEVCLIPLYFLPYYGGSSEGLSVVMRWGRSCCGQKDKKSRGAQKAKNPP
ncbi:helix-turn-helix domain-containing protein [Citrobacter sp. Cpo037]|uniref:helix-turn-helix domain-containing protein n=1 Tax=Citrobacter TaxID=544 RepID=UPI00214D86D5|nr:MULTISPECIES: helix-turn-helix domain-containing protein [Citrobacter]MCR3698343.1 helix-turn-helix domain-containing protein [Citrobacter portucalensis]MDM2900688.1 helix-turn-helix domain-containing protein [Citrobacter sp. Cpo037]